MSKEKFTKGPWTAQKGKAWVISESDNGLTINGATGDEAISYYGGNLIGESISEANAHLIAAAPDMYDLLATIENDDKQVPAWLWDKIQLTLAKARGE